MIVHEENGFIRTENGGMTDVVWLFFVTLPIDNSLPCHVQLRIPSDGTLLAMALPLAPPSWLWCPLSICFPLHHRCGVRVVYALLHRRLTAANWYAMRYDTLCGLSEKDIRLLFRLVNFCQPSCFLFHGASEVLVDMFRAAAPHAEFLAYLPSEVPTRVFIYEDKAHRCLSSLPSIFPFGSMMVVRGIHRNAAAETAWKTLKQRAEVTLTFDLGRFGIALSVEKMVKQDYIVCYF